MSEWPEALIEKVATALNTELEICQSNEPCAKHERYLWDLATTVLATLGLREETDVHWSGAPQHRYVTGWEDV